MSVSSTNTETGPLVVVLGPTGSGKSDLAIELAALLNGEIVNFDSVQMYRHLLVGAAKTPPEERRGIPHHLLDIVDPAEQFTAGEYVRRAIGVIRDVAQRGRLPILAGGTGFYLRALLEGISEAPARDDKLRERLISRGPERLHRLLRRLDPAAARRIHANDTNKLIRALEIRILSRSPSEALFAERPLTKLEDFTPVRIGLSPPRAPLSAKLDDRCLRMWEQGLPEETESILQMGYGFDSPALRTIGYREAVQFLRGELSRDEAISRMQAATRQYAKRQRTWFRREPDVLWLEGFGQDPAVQQTALARVRSRIGK